MSDITPTFVEMFRSVALFQGVSDAALEEIARTGAIEVHPTSKVLFTQGEGADCMYLVLSGSLGITSQVGGIHHTLAIRRRGEVVGEMALLDDAPRSATATVRRSARLLKVPSTSFRRLIAHDRALALAIMRSLTLRMRVNQEREEDLVRQLRSRNLQLERLNSRLEQKVQERTRELRQANKHLQDLYLLDGLTGVHNRRWFQERLEHLVSSDTAFALALLDVDHFKRVNDTFGHQAGDHVLIGVAQLIARKLGRRQAVARYGGEEFALLLPVRTRARALSVTEDVRSVIAATDLGLPNGHLVTASLGVACFPADASDAVSLLRKADEALYEAKASGRNRVVATSPGSTS